MCRHFQTDSQPAAAAAHAAKEKRGRRAVNSRRGEREMRGTLIIRRLRRRLFHENALIPPCRHHYRHATPLLP